RAAMNAWGVRQVTIENLAWGDVNRSLSVLRGRSRFRHVHRMVDEIEDRYSELQRPVEMESAATVAIAAPQPAAPRAEPVVRVASRIPAAAETTARLVPFRTNVNR